MTAAIERLIVTIILLALVVLVLIESAGLSPVARWMPLVVAVPTLVLLCLEFVADAARTGGVVRLRLLSTPGLSRLVSRVTRQRPEGSDDVRQREEWRALLWLGIAIATVLALGMLAGLTAYLILYLRVRAGQPWKVAIVVATGFLLVMYVGLDLLLRMRLY